jgi:FixJ family two-component response regulator
LQSRLQTGISLASQRRPPGGALQGDWVLKRDATVFIVDDDPEVRDALTRLLRSADWTSESYGLPQEFLATAADKGVGCILLDVNMPGMAGPELHDRLREQGVDLPVIYLTGNCTVSIGVRAMKNGAVDFLEKPVDADTLLATIDAAVARHRKLRAEGAQTRDITERLAKLSGRERDVFDQVILGRLNKQIAADLGIAEKTVKVHRGRVMAKMKVRSVAQLVHLWEQLPPQ